EHQDAIRLHMVIRAESGDTAGDCGSGNFTIKKKFQNRGVHRFAVVLLVLANINGYFLGRSGVQHVPSRLSIYIGCNSPDVKATAPSAEWIERDAGIYH